MSIFTPFWQEIDNFHFKFEFYNNENYKIASTWIIKKSWNTSKRSHFGYILAVGSTLKGSLLVANNKSMSYKVDSFINHSTCQNWCCLLTSAGEVSWGWERERQVVYHLYKIPDILVGNFWSVRTVCVIYHWPKISGLSPHTRLNSSYNMTLVRN